MLQHLGVLISAEEGTTRKLHKRENVGHDKEASAAFLIDAAPHNHSVYISPQILRRIQHTRSGTPLKTRLPHSYFPSASSTFSTYNALHTYSAYKTSQSKYPMLHPHGGSPVARTHTFRLHPHLSQHTENSTRETQYHSREAVSRLDT